MFRLASRCVGLLNVSRKQVSLGLSLSSQSGDKKFVELEPAYLDHMQPEIPHYSEVNVQIQGYDYPVLESFQKFVHKIAASLEIDNDESWALPAQKLAITRTEPNSSIVDRNYHLNIYERNIQVVDVPSNIMAIFIETIQAALPEGVNMQVHSHTKEHEKDRYIPDLELIELEQKLEEMGGPREVRPLKRK